MYRLRGHHLLCLLGYRGMGYSPEYITNMTRLHQTLRTIPETEVLLVASPDDLCEKFPENQAYHCEEADIHERDAEILVKLDLHVGQILPWKELQERIAQKIASNDIPLLCNTCSWRTYGVCEEGIKDLKAGKGLRVVEPH